MKTIAIHHRPGSFSDRWIAYCEKKQIPYRLVNVFDSDIVSQLKGCTALMWHHHHGVYKDVIAAKKILFALEHAGFMVFPNFKTGWHFDDKVAQKYLLESIGAPLVPSYVFYEKKEAAGWARETSYPKVFKLKGGAGAANVRLVENKKEAIKLINKSFGKGFRQYDRFAALRDRFRKFKIGQISLFSLVKGIARFFIPNKFSRQQPNEKGYAYFQDFIPDNEFDLRVIVIGDRALAVKRLVRQGDFRASGSGLLKFERENIDERCVRLAFKVNEKINAQSVAYDFVYGKKGEPLIIEISYGFSVKPYDLCPGYWDKNMKWYEGEMTPQDWMVDEMIRDKGK